LQVKFRNGLDYIYVGDIYLQDGKVIIEMDDFSRKFFDEFHWYPGSKGRKVHITPADGVLFLKIVLLRYADSKTVTLSIEDRDSVWLAPYLKDENAPANGKDVPSEAHYVYA
jgi:hypothetical protein